MKSALKRKPLVYLLEAKPGIHTRKVDLTAVLGADSIRNASMGPQMTIKSG